VALWWKKFSTRVLFSDSPLSLTFLIEQFWGRAARASWIRRNPDARLIFSANDRVYHDVIGKSASRTTFKDSPNKTLRSLKMKKSQVSMKSVAMGCTFALALVVVVINVVPARAQAAPKTLVKHVLSGTYYDASPSYPFAQASCNTSGCQATANMYTESISCPGATGVKCTYEVDIAAQTGLQSGEGQYQFLIDGVKPNNGYGTDPNGFWNWGIGQNGGGWAGSTCYTVTSQVTNSSANQSHSIVVNLGCSDAGLGNPGCFVNSGPANLTVRVLKP